MRLTCDGPREYQSENNSAPIRCFHCLDCSYCLTIAVTTSRIFSCCRRGKLETTSKTFCTLDTVQFPQRHMKNSCLTFADIVDGRALRSGNDYDFVRGLQQRLLHLEPRAKAVTTNSEGTALKPRFKMSIIRTIKFVTLLAYSPERISAQLLRFLLLQ